MKLLLSFFLATGIGFGAISGTTEWDVRTTGSDANGGGFDTASAGTDRSQQDAAFFAYTDIVIGATTTQGTSAGRAFITADAGNIINVVSGAGCTVQRVQVVSVTGTTATFDKTLGTAASTCTGNLGGALLTISKGFNVSESQANTIHLKSGTYTLTVGVTANGASCKLIGYGTTHNDGGTRPLITTATNTTKLIALVAAQYIFANINFSSTAVTKADGVWAGGAGGNIRLTGDSLTFDGFLTAIDMDNSAPTLDGTFQGTNIEVKNCTSDGIRVFESAALFGGSWIHNNTISGVRVQANYPLVFHDSISSNNGGFGLNQAYGGNFGSVYVSHSAIVSNGTDGINAGAGTPFVSIDNSIIYGNSGWGILVSNTAQMISLSNAFGSNTNGVRTGATNYGQRVIGDITLTANPFVSSTNFALNGTAGGGALLTSAGTPGTFAGGLTVGTQAVGAVQSGGGAAASQRAFSAVQ